MNFNEIIRENIAEHNPHWPQILDHPYKIPIESVSVSGKTNSLLNLTNHQAQIDKS